MIKSHTLKFAFMLICLLLCLSANSYAVQGDCDGSGSVDAADLTYLIAYLYTGGPPPVVYDDCDCDGFEGVNFGDLEQITDFLFSGGPLFAPPGPDLLTVSRSGVMIVGEPDGVGAVNVRVYMSNPVALNGGMTLPFSFAPAAGNADLIVTSLLVGPFFAPSVSGNIYNVDKAFVLDAQNGVPSTANWELLCDVTFALDPLGAGPGTPVEVHGAPWRRMFPLLLRDRAYNGTNYVRMQTPRYIPDAFKTIGDVDCSGGIAISDAVYLVNYIFGGGPPPADPDNDGIPECPEP